MGTDNAAAEDLQFAALPDEAELHGIPEDAAKFLQGDIVVRREAKLAVVLEGVGEDLMGVHRDVAEAIMDARGLWSVSAAAAVPKACGGGEVPGGEHFEEGQSR